MELRIFLIFYIYVFRRLTIAVTPVCQKSIKTLIDNSNHYETRLILTCSNVTDYVYEKWYYKSPCQYSDWNQFRKRTLKINNSNLPIITQNFTNLIYNCNFDEIEITHTKIKKIILKALELFFRDVQKLDLSFNEISNLDFLTTNQDYYSCRSLRHLNLNNNKLVKITASDFKYLKNLEILSIGYNNVYTIENIEKKYLKNLKELNLNNNKLSKIQFDQFQSFHNLEILNLANNDIEFLDGRLLLNLNNLKILNFEGNKIKVLQLKNNTNYYNKYNTFVKLYLQNNPLSLFVNQTYFDFQYYLSTLDLSRCKVLVLEDIFKNLTLLTNLKLTDSPLKKIAPNAFSSLSNLNELDLSNNRLTTLNEFTFTGLKNLTTLDLSNNPINLIFRAFAEFKILFTLNISVAHYGITNNTFYKLRSVREINFINSSILNISVGAFSEMDELEILRLQNTSIKNIASKAFQHLSFNVFESVTRSNNTIKLGNNFLCALESDTFSSIFNVNDIELDNNLIVNIHAGAFKDVNMVAGESKINLTNNNLIHIANDTFSGIAHLRVLLISYNKLATIEANGFRSLNDLELLDLSHNNLQEFNDNTFSSLKQLKLLNLTQNKLTTLSSNLFGSLVNLKTLVLNNNDIQRFPLGTFKHSSSLTDLYLANNKISHFQFGSFSNLVGLLSLDLSNNNLLILNESVLYPLRKLELLNLANNNFSYLNYTSLVLHLPHIRFICVNNNNWNCQFLTDMLKNFSLQNIDYLLNKIENYTVENVEGIPCHQIIEQTKEKNDKFEISSTITNTNNLEIHKEAKIYGKSENSVFMHSSEFLDNPKLINEFNNLNSNKITIIVGFLILFTCIALVLLQIFSLYKKYYSTSRKFEKSAEMQNSYSPIELLNTSECI